MGWYCSVWSPALAKIASESTAASSLRSSSIGACLVALVLGVVPEAHLLKAQFLLMVVVGCAFPFPVFALATILPPDVPFFSLGVCEPHVCLELLVDGEMYHAIVCVLSVALPSLLWRVH